MKKIVCVFAFTAAFITCKQELKEDSKNNLLVKNIPCLPANLTSHLLAFYPFPNGSLNNFSGNATEVNSLFQTTTYCGVTPAN
jgi:hypothetical protein